MNFYIIIIVFFLCSIITLFLIKESYTSKKRIVISIISVFVGIISTVFSIYITFTDFKKEEEYLLYHLDNLNTEIDDINSVINKINIDLYDMNTNSNINNLDNISSSDNLLINWEEINSSMISMNFSDTEIDNSGTKFIFHNHPEDEGAYNTLNFSFILNQKYNYFSCCVNIDDNIDNENLQATKIRLFANDEIIYSSEELYNSSLPIYIYLDLSNVSTLSFSIKTNMIATDDEIIRTVSFSEIDVR